MPPMPPMPPLPPLLSILSKRFLVMFSKLCAPPNTLLKRLLVVLLSTSQSASLATDTPSRNSMSSLCRTLPRRVWTHWLLPLLPLFLPLPASPTIGTTARARPPQLQRLLSRKRFWISSQSSRTPSRCWLLHSNVQSCSLPSGNSGTSNRPLGNTSLEPDVYNLTWFSEGGYLEPGRAKWNKW